MGNVTPIRPGMPTSEPRPTRKRKPGHVHEFDPISGWCAHCTYRDDGRLIGPGGVVYHEGTANDGQPQDENEDNS